MMGAMIRGPGNAGQIESAGAPSAVKKEPPVHPARHGAGRRAV